MKKCKCGAMIEDKYQMCTKCNNERINERANKNIEPEPTIMEKCNWNWGKRMLIAKFTLLSKLEELKGKQLTEVQQRIYDCLLKDLDKDLKAFGKIGGD